MCEGFTEFNVVKRKILRKKNISELQEATFLLYLTAERYIALCPAPAHTVTMVCASLFR